MKLIKPIVERRSIRRFQDREVEEEKLKIILEAARLAPSGTNRQPWRFVLLTEQKHREKIAPAVAQPFVTAAPALFVCCIDKTSFIRDIVNQRITELVENGAINEETTATLYNRELPEKLEDVKIAPSAYMNLGIAVEHMALQATALGLGSCWIGLFDAAQVHEILKLPDEIEVGVLLPVGYPAQSPLPRPRLKLEQLLIKPRLS